MKRIKSYQQFNETLDMFMMPVDPMEAYMKWWDDFSSELKAKFSDFIKRLKQEAKETKEAFDLCVKASKEGKDLSEREREKIWTQLKDVFKSIGLGVISVMPGGVIVYMLIKFLKAEKLITPSSFIK